jgi:DNA-binding response OmpR family regulator
MAFRILLVEDDNRLSALVAGYLRKHDYEVEVVLNGNDAVPAILKRQPDLVILDVNLPGKDGFQICREAREQFDGVIIMVTARDEQFDEVLGLEFGADDYVHKPVEPRVLLARIKAQLRRVAGRGVEIAGQPERYTFGKFEINRATRTVTLPDGSRPDLTSAELCRRSGEPRRPDAAIARHRIRRTRPHHRRRHFKAAPQAARRFGYPAADQDRARQGLSVQQSGLGIGIGRLLLALGS